MQGERYLQVHCIQAGPQLKHGVHLSLDLQQIPGCAPTLLGKLGNCLAGVVYICALVYSFPDNPKAASAYHLANGVPA